MLVLILLMIIIIIIIIIYLATKKDSSKQKTCTREISESMFNPYYRLSKDKNGLEVVEWKNY
jgi:hypothetical protein